MEKFKAVIKNEIIIYLGMFLILSFIAHGDLLGEPSARFQMMSEKENYFHPLLYVFIVYSVFLILRKTLGFIFGLFERNN
jgi:hypothetical protein